LVPKRRIKVSFGTFAPRYPQTFLEVRRGPRNTWCSAPVATMWRSRNIGALSITRPAAARCNSRKTGSTSLMI